MNCLTPGFSSGYIGRWMFAASALWSLLIFSHLLAEILNFGLTKHNVCVTARALVCVRLLWGMIFKRFYSRFKEASVTIPQKLRKFTSQNWRIGASINNLKRTTTAMTKRIFLDFRMVTLVTPGTCFRPSLVMILRAWIQQLQSRPTVPL